MDSNLVTLLVSGTIMLTTAGAWLWFGYSVRGSSNVVKKQLLDSVTPAATEEQILLVPEVMPPWVVDKVRADSPLRIVINEALDPNHSVDKLVAFHNGDVSKAMESVKTALSSAREDVLRDLLEQQRCTAEVAHWSSILEKEPGTLKELSYATEMYKQAVKEMVGQRIIYAEDYETLTHYLNDWVKLEELESPAAMRVTSPTAQELLTTYQPSVVNAAAETSSAVAESDGGNTLLWGLSSGEVFLLIAFGVATTFFVTGLIHRYRQSKSEGEGDEPGASGGEDSTV